MSIHIARKSSIRFSALTYANGLWESIDTAISLSCHLLAKYGEWEQLVRKSVDPLDYLHPKSFFDDYQSVKLLSKYPFLKTGIDTRLVAAEKFIEAENQCRLTNARFRLSRSSLTHGRVGAVIQAAQRKIATILGRVPSLAELDFSFGPGAAYGVRGETSVFNKVTADLECTYAFSSKLSEFLAEFPGWIPEGVHDVVVVPGSELTFVPKDAKTDRPICIEPLLNGLYQKGVGSYLRRRLSHHGINLDDQSINQKLASVAHIESLSTIDFSSASDTISYNLVLELLPIDWFEFLDVARCPRFSVDGRWFNFQKFSSMGNAYTFELESLIFYALAYASMELCGLEPKTGINLSVYGDDVIIARDAFDLFSEVSEACGFTISREKSFKDGPFFESCGHDYFHGVLVRPYLLKRKTSDLLGAFYAANSVVRIALRSERTCGTNQVLAGRAARRFRDLHARCVSAIPRPLRTLGPEGYGDGHLIAPFDASHPVRHKCYDAWSFYSYVDRPRLVRKASWPTAYALYFTRHQGARHPGEITRPPDNGIGYSVRGRTSLTRARMLCHFMWPDMCDSFWLGYQPYSN